MYDSRSRPVEAARTTESRQTYLRTFGFTPASKLRFDEYDQENDTDE
jgi:hypothetical protein